MSLSKSLDADLHRDLSPVAPEYGEEMEDVYGMGDWPSDEEQQLDAERSDFN